MRAFLAACAVALVMAVGASVILGGLQTQSEQAFATRSVRLQEPAAH